MSTIQTPRLKLRPFTSDDFEPFAAINADPRVMEFFVAPLTREQSDKFANVICAQFAKHGYGLWAVETPGSKFAGYIGLCWGNFDAPFMPALEVGFRLAADQWGNGYATEGGIAAVDWAFTNTDVRAVCSWTAVINRRSERVMQKIGLLRDASNDFDHPRVPEGNPLRPHVFYRVTREQWYARK
jgi:RimJ/RimL family protein N-acetyltransferase